MSPSTFFSIAGILLTLIGAVMGLVWKLSDRPTRNETRSMIGVRAADKGRVARLEATQSAILREIKKVSDSFKGVNERLDRLIVPRK